MLFSHLRPHDQVVLDCWDRVFVWSGRFSASKDSFFALQVAQTYLEQGGRKALRVEEVKDTAEPLHFISYFLGWRYPEAVMVQQMSKACDVVLFVGVVCSSVFEQEASEVRNVVMQYAQHYTLQELQQKVRPLPPPPLPTTRSLCASTRCR